MKFFKNLRGFTPYFIFVTEKGQTEQKNRPNEKEHHAISWEKMTKFVDFFKIEALKKMPTKIGKLKMEKIEYSDYFSWHFFYYFDF